MSIEIRISHSFPPNYSKNNQYLAQVHSIIEKLNLQIQPKDITFRSIQTFEEIEELKLLHKEWFPVEYQDHFFNNIQTNKMVKSIAAIYNFVHDDEVYPLVLGCLVYEYRFMDHDLAQFSFSDLCGDAYGIYILTFGVINELRSQGLGTILLNKVCDLARGDITIKYVYLDVVAYNNPGVRCYEKNGFVQVFSKRKHYNLFDERYDALVYCWYINGGRKPRSIKELLTSCVTCCGIPSKVFSSAKNKITEIMKNQKNYSKLKALKV